jgi:hypothetical protein
MQAFGQKIILMHNMLIVIKLILQNERKHKSQDHNLISMLIKINEKESILLSVRYQEHQRRINSSFVHKVTDFLPPPAMFCPSERIDTSTEQHVLLILVFQWIHLQQSLVRSLG